MARRTSTKPAKPKSSPKPKPKHHVPAPNKLKPTFAKSRNQGLSEAANRHHENFLESWTSSSQSNSGLRHQMHINHLEGRHATYGVHQAKRLVKDVKKWTPEALEHERKMVHEVGQHEAKKWDKTHKKGTVLHRGVTDAEETFVHKMKKGDTAHFTPLVSTAHKESVAKDFAGHRTETILHFHGVKGKHIYAHIGGHEHETILRGASTKWKLAERSVESRPDKYGVAKYNMQDKKTGKMVFKEAKSAGSFIHGKEAKSALVKPLHEAMMNKYTSHVTSDQALKHVFKNHPTHKLVTEAPKITTHHFHFHPEGFVAKATKVAKTAVKVAKVAKKVK